MKGPNKSIDKTDKGKRRIVIRIQAVDRGGSEEITGGVL